MVVPDPQFIPHRSLLSLVFGFFRQNIILTLLLGVFGLVVRRRYFHPLSKFPGPFFASVTTLWRIYFLLKNEQHLHDTAMHKKYGPVFRDSPNSLCFSDPNAIEAIYGHRPRGEFAKSNWYRVFWKTMDGSDSAFASLPVQQHKRLRKVVAGIYSMTSIIEYEPRFDTNVVRWIERLKEFKGEPIEFASWAQYLTLDIISDIVHGKPLGFVEKGGDVNGYQASLHEGFLFLTTFGYLQPAVNLMKSKLLGPLLHPSPKDKSGYGHLLGFADNMINDRIMNGNTIGRPHLVLDFINAKRADGSAISRDQMAAEVMMTINAGSDSTAVTIAAILNFLLRDRRVYEKLIDELTEASQKGQLSEPAASYNETTRLPYFNAVIKESMRLFPIFSANLTRVVAEGGYEVLPGIFVPEGTEVGMNSYVSHRDKDIFGEDAESFIPEKWLPLDGERARKMEKYLLVWSYGSRTCLGRNIAQIEVNKTIIELLRHFEISLLRPDLPLKIRNVVQMLIQNMFVQLVPRKNKL